MRDAIRLARPEDADAIAAIYAPFVRETHVSFETEPPAAEEMRRRIERARDFAPWLVHATDGSLDGYACGGRFHERAAYRWTVETSVYVEPARRRRGVGRALVTTLLDLLERQGFRTALAIISLPNDASVALYESLGFRPAGLLTAAGFKLGRWWDVGRWSRPLGAGGPPAELLSPAAIGVTQAWRASGDPAP